VGNGLPAAQQLRATALERRPDLLALANRIRAEEGALGLAHKEYFPDLEPFIMYDRFMGNTSQSRDLATMIGVKLNLPIRLAKRGAAVAEAHAKVVQRRAELARQIDQVNFQVQEAYEQVLESEKTVDLYKKTILPAAELNVKAALPAYMTGKIPALSWIEAQRNLVGLRDRYYEAVADFFRRRATLERTIGGPLVPSPSSFGPSLPGSGPAMPCGNSRLPGVSQVP
jgi:outer membrane protein TolC